MLEIALMRGPALLSLLLLSCGMASANRAADRAKREARPEVVAWVVPYEGSLESLERNAPWLTIVSPTYFRVAVSGKAAHLEDWDPAVPFPRARLAALREKASFEVIPLVGCVGPCGRRISRILDDAETRARHVADLVRVARAQELAGLFIDYEEIDAEEANVTRFVTELASGLHEHGMKLALAVEEPCGFDPSCRRVPFPFELGALSSAVDLLAVMEYDFAVDGSAPPAPRAWVERGLAKVARAVGEGQLHKVVCGVPLYGRISPGLIGTTEVLFHDVQPGRIRDAKVTMEPLTVDHDALSKIAKVGAGARSGTLYLEDRETLAARLAVASRFHLGGVALWRLGGEDPCTGGALARYRGMPAPPCS